MGVSESQCHSRACLTPLPWCCAELTGPQDSVQQGGAQLEPGSQRPSPGAVVGTARGPQSNGLGVFVSKSCESQGVALTSEPDFPVFLRNRTWS